jgi:hypothetical protein
MQSSQSQHEHSIVIAIILFGVLIACSSNDLLGAAFGVSLLGLGGALWRWG